MNKLIQDPAKNNIDPRIVNDLGKIEVPPKNQAEVISDVLQRLQEEIGYRQNLSEQLVERKKSYYKFGDLTRALIKFLTGLDITRKEAVNKSGQSESSSSIQKQPKSNVAILSP
jgi:hypothetical protein